MNKRFGRNVRVAHERLENDKRKVILYRIERPSNDTDREGKVDKITVRYIIWPFTDGQRHVEVAAFDNELGINLFEQIILKEHERRINKRVARKESRLGIDI
ncbi:hypothetical protein J4471_04535 [Candidatus Woesearchaeota archaeon]|nr:hypothetical protein [Candidatus Woesearchaeota archaeon]